MLLDELLDELEELRGQGFIVCFDIEGKGLDSFKDINAVEIDEEAGVIHLKNN